MKNDVRWALTLMLAAVTAAAQDSAVESAADAFGERVGTEQSGLYSETQVRGFDLNETGAYRIDDAYFSRAAALNDPVLAGVGVRVGVNAVRLAYPAASGVVNYRLRQAGPVDQLRLGTGLRDFGTRVGLPSATWIGAQVTSTPERAWRLQVASRSPSPSPTTARCGPAPTLVMYHRLLCRSTI